MQRNRLDPDEQTSELARLLAGVEAAPDTSFGAWHRDYVQPLGSAYPRQPAEWTKSYPGLANWLRNSLETAPMGLGLGPRAMPARPTAMSPKEQWAPSFKPSAEGAFEIPAGAATKYGDQIFRSPVHGMEVDAAKAALGPERYWQMMNNGEVISGFMTNRGRFVDRAEATALAQQSDPNYRPVRYGFDSNDLRPFDPTPRITAKVYLEAEGSYPAAINRLEAQAVAEKTPDARRRFKEAADTLREWRSAGPERANASMREAGYE
jgi:hypothetical protein